MSLLSISLHIHLHVCVCVCVRIYICLFLYFFMSASACVCMCLNSSGNSVPLAAWGFSIMLLPRYPSRQPGGDGVRGGLLGHAIVADHCVETAPRVGILGSVVRFQRGWDTPLVLWGRNRGGLKHVLMYCVQGLGCKHISLEWWK